MSDTDTNDIPGGLRHRAKRRDVLKYAGQATAVAGGLTLLAACGDLTGNPFPPAPTPTPTPTPTPPPPPPTGGFTEIDYLNFALSVSYLKANFFSVSAFGTALDPSLMGDNPGTIVGTGQGKLAFATTNANNTPLLSIVQEQAAEAINHVKALRDALGSKAVPMPTIDIGSSGTGGAGADAFSVYANTAKGTAGNFAPYTVDRAFIAASAFLNSEILAAYLGVLANLTTPSYIALMTGLIGGASYHTSAMRTFAYLHSAAGDIPAGLTQVNQFAIYADSLDGAIADDKGITDSGGNTPALTDPVHIVSADADGLAFGKQPANVLNVFFITPSSVTKGGFFPKGINGTIVGSAAAA